MRKALYGKPKAESRVFELYKKEKSTAHDDCRQKRCVSVFAFISLFSPQFLAARRSLPFQSNTPHCQECLTMRRIPLYNTLRVIKWWRRCVTCIFQVETHMDILNYPIAMAVIATIVIEKILIQDVGFSLQYAPSIKTTGWKMLSCNSARPCVFASCAVWRSVSLSWSLNAELSLAIASYFQLLTLYHVWTSLSIYQL